MKALTRILVAIFAFLLPGVTTQGAEASGHAVHFSTPKAGVAAADALHAAFVIDTDLPEDGLTEVRDLLDDRDNDEDSEHGGIFRFPGCLDALADAADIGSVDSGSPDGRYLPAGAARCVYLRRLLI